MKARSIAACHADAERSHRPFLVTAKVINTDTLLNFAKAREHLASLPKERRDQLNAEWE